MTYFIFESTGLYTGKYTLSSKSTSVNTVTGSVVAPSDIIKIDHEPTWSSITTLSFTNLSSTLSIGNLISSNWTTSVKNEWFQSYLKYVGMKDLIDSDYYAALFQIAVDENIFYKISYPSIAYVTQDTTTSEVSIGMSVYNMDFILNAAFNMSHDNPLKQIILNNHHKNEDGTPFKVYVSGVAKVMYQGITKNVWCFDGIEYDYNISELGFTPTLETGGGHVFGEVKMAGNGVKASYILKKDVDENDPTLGLASGVATRNFCMGDKIYLIDTSVWTTNTSSDWTWVGDYSQLEYKWHIADITTPTEDFKSYGIDNLLFPVRVLEECQLGHFGINIINITKHHIITDIIVNVDAPVDWKIYETVVISDLESDSLTGYNGDWELIAKGSNESASNGSAASVYLRLRRIGFDNRNAIVVPTKGQIYLR